jgi:bifunctional non-homologous end joining protein LigD
MKSKGAPSQFTVSNPDKVLYPAAKFTKADVVDYYLRVAPFLLPHFQDRPVTLKRYPDGVHGEAFYEKDAPAYAPEWVNSFPVPRREGGPDINYILINDVATLAWCANISALELHPFLHRVPRIEVPSHVVFDLDPGEGADLRNCIKVAFLLREVLRKLRLKSFPKVSGSKGLQLYVPLNTATELRSDTGIRADGCTVTRARARRSRSLSDVEESPARKDLHRLEPERES